MNKETKTEKRAPRAQETRETKKAKTPWKPPSMLEVPNDPPAGTVYRWIRAETLGQEDRTNVSKRFREGWEPVLASEHPEMHVMPDVDSKFEGNVEVGGLLLCKTSTENVEARKDYMSDQNAKAMEAVDNNYMRESDPRMPLLRPEKSTRST